MERKGLSQMQINNVSLAALVLLAQSNPPTTLFKFLLRVETILDKFNTRKGAWKRSIEVNTRSNLIGY